MSIFFSSLISSFLIALLSSLTAFPSILISSVLISCLRPFGGYVDQLFELLSDSVFIATSPSGSVLMFAGRNALFVVVVVAAADEVLSTFPLLLARLAVSLLLTLTAELGAGDEEVVSGMPSGSFSISGSSLFMLAVTVTVTVGRGAADEIEVVARAAELLLIV
jgi:hypothetical protein